jgi:hypothetical protein
VISWRRERREHGRNTQRIPVRRPVVKRVIARSKRRENNIKNYLKE